MIETKNGTIVFKSRAGLEIMFDPENGWSNELDLAGLNALLQSFELTLEIPPAVANPYLYLAYRVAEEFDLEILAAPAAPRTSEKIVI